ncbi:hypothetical protein HQ529_06650 [Candidatus Woesearchaeota archaeon]|nr:hypothetical protein [Candidatus Woesearchaeota archaeon]
MIIINNPENKVIFFILNFKESKKGTLNNKISKIKNKKGFGTLKKGIKPSEIILLNLL